MRIGNLLRASRKCAVGRVRSVGVLVSALESLAWAFCLMGQQDIRAAEPKRSLEQEGQALAKEVRQFRPSHNLTNRASLKVRDTDGRLTSVPVTVSVQALEDSWQILYRWRNHQGQTSTVSILHRENQIPAYETSDSAKAGELASAPRRVDPEQSHEPLAGSDFWLCDLGLEFLYWPEQRVIRSEPHSTRMCRVLESKSPQGRPYAKVLSWIETDEHALLSAEAYDSNGKRMKQFSIGSFTSEGPRDLKMRDLVKGSTTDLLYQD